MNEVILRAGDIAHYPFYYGLKCEKANKSLDGISGESLSWSISRAEGYRNLGLGAMSYG